MILWSGYIKTDKNVSLGDVFVNFENSGLLGGWGMSELGDGIMGVLFIGVSELFYWVSFWSYYFNSGGVG